MPQQNLLIAVIAVAIVNGIFSPWVLAIFVLYPVWFPSFLPPYAQIVYMLSALLLSTLTIMVAGVPAALTERFSGKAGDAPMLVWLGGAILLTLPALPNVVKALLG